jgi:hypothetical protein
MDLYCKGKFIGPGEEQSPQPLHRGDEENKAV